MNPKDWLPQPPHTIHDVKPFGASAIVRWLAAAHEGTRRELRIAISSYGEPPRASLVSVEIDMHGAVYRNSEHTHLAFDGDDSTAALAGLETMAAEEVAR